MNVVFFLLYQQVEKDFNLEAYLKEQLWWPPDEIKDVKIDGFPGKQLKNMARVDTLKENVPTTVTDIRTFVVVNDKLFNFFFEEEIIGETGYQILDSVKFL
jgi:hypothetical protein